VKPELYTVEWEECRTGQTAEGVGKFWFKCVEVFREGMYDDIHSRAQKFAIARWGKAIYRNIVVTPWYKEEVMPEFDPNTPVRSNING